MDRRTFVKSTLSVLGAPVIGGERGPWGTRSARTRAQSQDVLVDRSAQDDPRPPKGERPYQETVVQVENPGEGVPVSLIIDDSTCLVNMAHYGIPQFRQAFPDRYGQDWKSLPREIPDSFVRSFVRWSREHGVKGKYSIVPYPACVGWVDRFTLSVPDDARSGGEGRPPVLSRPQEEKRRLTRTDSGPPLAAGTWREENGRITYCFDLPVGESRLRLG